MNKHHTKFKGDIGLTNAIADLTTKGFAVSIPLSEHLPYDLIADGNGKLYKVQVKYSASGIVDLRSSWADRAGSHSFTHDKGAFDVVAVFLANIGTVVYVPWDGSFESLTVRTTLPETKSAQFLWYEDLLTIKDSIPKRKTLLDFPESVVVKTNNVKQKSKRPAARKVEWPTKEELESLIESKTWTAIAESYGVSDTAVRKWAKSYGII